MKAYWYYLFFLLLKNIKILLNSSRFFILFSYINLDWDHQSILKITYFEKFQASYFRNIKQPTSFLLLKNSALVPVDSKKTP